jgi:hypothetical protein
VYWGCSSVHMFAQSSILLSLSNNLEITSLLKHPTMAREVLGRCVREPPIVLISPTPKDKALHLHIAITTCTWCIGFSPPLLLSKSSLLPTETVHWSRTGGSLLYITTCLYIVSLVPTVIYRQRSQLGRTKLATNDQYVTQAMGGW